MRIANQVAQTAPAITLVQSTSKPFSGGNTLAFTSNNTAGNLLLAGWTGAANGTIADSQGNAWNLLQTFTDSGNVTYLYYCTSCKGGANTVTFQTGGNPGGTIAEFSGVTTLDQSGSFTGTGLSGSWTTNAITTLFAKELLVGIGHAAFAFLTVTAPFNVLGINETNVLMYYQIVSTIQTGVTAAGTQTSNAGNFWGVSLNSFYTPTVNPNSINNS